MGWIRNIGRMRTLKLGRDIWLPVTDQDLFMQDTLVAETGQYDALRSRLDSRDAKIGVVGLGYVGLPLVAATARAAFPVLGFDVDDVKVDAINAGESYIDAVTSSDVSAFLDAGRLEATVDFSRLAECDVILICVPTPLTKQREPDLSYVLATAETIARSLRPGQLVVLESTTYPGTTEEVVRPALEQSGLRCGQDFWVGYSPEREDPGSRNFHTSAIPKVVSGLGDEARDLVTRFYGAVVEKVVPVSSPAAAEAVKITENVFRAVNIALVNELKVIYEKFGIDVWEVIDAASTKPFGFMPFYPGPGLGGHCIPIDPFYLAWKAREYGVATRFIELAGEINTDMPRYVLANLERAIDQAHGRSLGASRVLLLGLAYKKNVGDIRESPAFALLEMLEKRGTATDFHDPFVPVIPRTREHAALAGRPGVALTPEAIASYDAILVVTDHDAIDYSLVLEHARLIVDTRDAFGRRGLTSSRIVKS
jgi:UDP-N-acetyl-D-glucosamine dehydrogenase